MELIFSTSDGGVCDKNLDVCDFVLRHVRIGGKVAGAAGLTDDLKELVHDWRRRRYCWSGILYIGLLTLSWLNR